MKIVFWLSAAVIAYTYFGYPAWLWLCSRLRPKPVHSTPFAPFISIVLVVRNESPVLRDKLDNLLAFDYPADLAQIIVVSDGSNDGTDAILHEYGHNPSVNVLLGQLPRGKASGLNDAISLAQGEIIVFTDARQKLSNDSVRVLIENFADSSIGCVSGELMLCDPNSSEAGKGIGVYWNCEKKIRQWESASGSVVGATGALYAVRKDLLTVLPPETILDDVFVPLQVVRQGSRVVFEPRARAWETAKQTTNREFARKVRTLSGNYQLLQLAPWLLTARNPIRFRFVSHKLLRLVIPFALLAVLISSLILREPIYRVTLVLQLTFYALSLLALLPVKLGFLGRVTNAAWTFVLLNSAAAVAFMKFISGRKIAWNRPVQPAAISKLASSGDS
jgi:cellulose synthase/poly-beta-1,6-N-acetylglucosamine synthase-like glycosyltransferase